MPLQNRVTPTGDIIATPHRGLFTGNRGIIHDPATKTLKRRWANKAWLAAVDAVQQAYSAGRAIAGWEPDEAARTVIRNAGFGEFFTHRTGHNIAVELHGSGAHLDNLETHDERLILPNTCFSVEPGLYFPGEFGVRSEIDMMTAPGKAWVTGKVQRELVRV